MTFDPIQKVDAELDILQVIVSHLICMETNLHYHNYGGREQRGGYGPVSQLTESWQPCAMYGLTTVDGEPVSLYALILVR